jgi:CRP-like cAMP-binding protein
VRAAHAPPAGASHDACVDLLDKAPLFGVLQRDDLHELAHKFYPVRFRKRETIFREGEPAERLFIVGEGRVKLTVSSSRGGELLVAMVGRGELFGELAVIDKGPRAMSARAMEDVVVFGLGADVFWSLIESRPPLAHRLLELMARRLRRADQTAQDLVFDDAETRLARKLLHLAETHGRPTGHVDEVRIAARVTQEELAQMIGVSRSRANRLIQSFVGQGWLDWNDGHPILLRPEALLRRAR